MMKTKEPNPYTPASDREVLVDHVNDESNLLTEKERLRILGVKVVSNVRR